MLSSGLWTYPPLLCTVLKVLSAFAEPLWVYVKCCVLLAVSCSVWRLPERFWILKLTNTNRQRSHCTETSLCSADSSVTAAVCVCVFSHVCMLFVCFCWGVFVCLCFGCMCTFVIRCCVCGTSEREHAKLRDSSWLVLENSTQGAAVISVQFMCVCLLQRRKGTRYIYSSTVLPATVWDVFEILCQTGQVWPNGWDRRSSVLKGWSYKKDNYKYLGNPKANGNHDKCAQRKATAKYLQKVKQQLRSQPNSRNKMQAITTYTSRYPAGIISWPQEEIDASNMKIWKLLTVCGRLHLKTSRGSMSNGNREGED